MKPVTDPAILEQLNQKSAVTDPDLLAKLEGTSQAPKPSYMETVKGRLSAIADPETYKGMLDFPPIDRPEGKLPEGFMEDPQAVDIAKDVAIMAPTTAMSQATRLMGKPAQTAAAKAKESALMETAKSGYTLPKSNIKSTWATNLMERFGGKQAIEHVAGAKSQALTNAKAARALGLADDAPITPDALDALRASAGKAYDAVKVGGTANADKVFFDTLDDIAKSTSGASKAFPRAASKQTKQFVDKFKEKVIDIDGALDQVRILRAAASKSYASPAPADKLMGKAQRKVADAIDDFVERSIAGKAPPDAFKNYVEARQLIAKSHTVEDALKGFNVDAVKLGQVLKKKKGLLSGELKDIAKFGQNHPNIARIRPGDAPSGGSLEPMAYAATGVMTTGNPAAAISAAVPIIGKPIARHLATKVPKAAKPSRGVLENALIQKPLPAAGVALDRNNRNNSNR